MADGHTTTDGTRPGGTDAARTPAPDRHPEPDHRTEPAGSFAREWQLWHAEHEHALAAPYGFLAITALHRVDAEPRRFDGVPGTWRTGAGGAVVALDPDEELAVDGLPVAVTHTFAAVPERGGHQATYGDTVLEVAKRGGQIFLRPRHPLHPLRAQFRGTPTFAPHPRWAVRAHFAALDRPRPTTVRAAVEGLEHVYDALGTVRFTLDGQEHTLTALRGYDHRLLLLFTDETSGVTTHPATRVLLAEPPGPDGTLVLDFNRTANLPCAYTAYATCPLPPPENRLTVAIEAGEQLPRQHRDTAPQPRAAT